MPLPAPVISAILPSTIPIRVSLFDREATAGSRAEDPSALADRLGRGRLERRERGRVTGIDTRTEALTRTTAPDHDAVVGCAVAPVRDAARLDEPRAFVAVIDGDG